MGNNIHVEDKKMLSNFLNSVESEIINEIEHHTSLNKLIKKFRKRKNVWEEEYPNFLNEVNETVNELCIAKILTNHPNFKEISYEPKLIQTGKSIDFLLTLNNGEKCYFDVKTINPDFVDSDSIEQQKKKYSEWFKNISENINLIIEGDEFATTNISKFMVASRSKMLNYSIELEEKIQGNNLNGEHTYTMIFCGDNTTWHKDELEDFSHLYFNDAFRPDDSFGKMQKQEIFFVS
jgi:hypothetical protein